jgi:hypothetical protein
VNLQLAPAQLDEAPTVAADDPVARDALEARRNQLHLSNSTVEKLANLCQGHCTKILGPSREKSPTLKTLDALLETFALSIVLINDPTKAERLPPWRLRDERKVRTRALSLTTIARAKPHVVSALLRRARHPRWKDTPAPAFLQAMALED